jgi:N utilization substance protein B
MRIKRRSQARMLALQALCAFEGVGDQFGAQLDEFLCDEQVLADLEVDVPPLAELMDFARTLAQGAWDRRDLLDEKLARTAAHWSVARMTPVDRNILRLGLYELLAHPDTPPQVVINEAIELARRFGDADSPAFVNGVLDAVWRGHAAATDSPADHPTDAEAGNETEGRDGAV